jgi:broad specificity phosphatase PhoE
MEAAKTIYLVRHGTTEYNQTDLLQGRMDNLLNERGIKEAELLSEHLKLIPFDAFYHSPLSRAKQTAEILNKPHHLLCVKIECFTEIDLGDWEGQKYQQLIVENREFHQRWMSDPALPIPGGESFIQVFNRVKPGIEEILKTDYKNILIVGHATVNRGILGNLIRMEPAIARLFRMKNASYSKLLFFKNPHRQYVIVESWNNTAHLDNLK